MVRNIKFTITLLAIASYSFGQSLDVDLVTNTHNGGYHISCFGANDGKISSVVTGGEAPYEYLWSSGATEDELISVGAGEYTLTVTDASGQTATAAIELTQPKKLQIHMDPLVLAGGTHISAHGASDGVIGTFTAGGIPPYTYEWNDGFTKETRKNLPAGEYSVVVRDANECANGNSTLLIQPEPLSLSLDAPMNGGNWHLTCYRSMDGSIDATVSGGVQPYSFDWSHGAFTEDVNGLKAGEYVLKVTDANGVRAQEVAYITEPEELDVTYTLLEYPNEHNTSCHDCYNGSVQFSTSGGAGGYSYAWEDGNTSASREDLGQASYQIQVSDANGCVREKTLELSIPTRDDWTMSGNEIQPEQFIGSTNEEDVEFRANNQPQLRLGADGTTELLGGVRTNGLENLSNDAASGARILVVDESGNLAKLGSDLPDFPFAPTIPPCLETPAGTTPWWENAPGKIYTVCEPVKVGIGTVNPEFKLDVNGTIQGEGIRLSSGSSLVRLDANGVFKNGSWGPGQESSLYLGDENHQVTARWGDAGEAGGLRFGVAGESHAMIIKDWSGKVGINVGANHSFGEGHLEVNGTIRSKKVVVEQSNWPDYVFSENYELMNLEEVRNFINDYGHLPGIPSAQTIEKDGMDLGNLVRLQMEKIEELTLYVIDLESRLIVETNSSDK